MARIQDVDIPHLEFAEAAAPGTPAGSIVRIYAKSDGLLYQKDDAGTETLLAGGAGGAPTDATYVTTSANGSLSAEVVIGAWTSYTPTWTSETSGSPSVGNGTLTGHFLTVGKLHFFRITLVCGSTTTFGTGRWNFSLGGSVSTSGLPQQVVSCHLVDNNVGLPHGGAAWISASATPVVRPVAVNSGSINGISSSVPWTWTTSDQVYIQGCIEIA